MDGGAAEVGRTVECQTVDIDICQRTAAEGNEGGEHSGVGWKGGKVGCGTLEVADEVGVSVCGRGGTQELLLTDGDLGEGGGDGTGLHFADGTDKVLAAEPAELAARGVVGEQLDGDGGVVGIGYLEGFLLGRFDEAPFHAAAFHTVGVVDIHTHCRAAFL